MLQPLFKLDTYLDVFLKIAKTFFVRGSQWAEITLNTVIINEYRPAPFKGHNLMLQSDQVSLLITFREYRGERIQFWTWN